MYANSALGLASRMICETNQSNNGRRFKTTPETHRQTSTSNDKPDKRKKLNQVLSARPPHPLLPPHSFRNMVPNESDTTQARGGHPALWGRKLPLRAQRVAVFMQRWNLYLRECKFGVSEFWNYPEQSRLRGRQPYQRYGHRRQGLARPGSGCPRDYHLVRDRDGQRRLGRSQDVHRRIGLDPRFDYLPRPRGGRLHPHPYHYRPPHRNLQPPGGGSFWCAPSFRPPSLQRRVLA